MSRWCIQWWCSLCLVTPSYVELRRGTCWPKLEQILPLRNSTLKWETQELRLAGEESGLWYQFSRKGSRTPNAELPVVTLVVFLNFKCSIFHLKLWLFHYLFNKLSFHLKSKSCFLWLANKQIHKLAGSTELPQGILYHGDFHYEAGPVNPLFIMLVLVSTFCFSIVMH